MSFTASSTSDAFTVFLPECFAIATASSAIISPNSVNCWDNSTFASFVALGAPAYDRILPIGAIGKVSIISLLYKNIFL